MNTPRPLSAYRGFTLLEVMLVLVIMGMTVSYVMFNAFGTSSSEELEDEAQRFQVVFDMAVDFAILNQMQMGVRIDQKENQYLFLTFNEDEQRWYPIEEDKTFASYQLPDKFSMEIELDGLPWVEEDSLFDQGIFDERLSLADEGVSIGDEEEQLPPPPQVFLLSSGEITPFSLSFIYEPEFSNEDPVYYKVNATDTPPLDREGPLDSL